MIDHPIFGPVRAAPRRPGRPWLWQSLDLVETPLGRADIAFEASAEGPGEAHRVQLREIVSRLDALTEAAGPLIFDRLSRQGAAVELWAELEWRGACLTGRQGEFQLEYSCRSRPESIAVRFEQSQPVAVELEA
jgi:hypothetical protein